MARTETDRQDLFAEAVSLIRRVEGRFDSLPVSVIAGIKSNGDASFYFGPDRVYHFDAEGRLRRAFVDGLLYRSQGDRLLRLRRDRSETETALLRSDLTDEETTAFQTTMRAYLETLHSAMTSGTFIISRRHPDADLMIETDMMTIIDTILVATSWLAPELVARR